MDGNKADLHVEEDDELTKECGDELISATEKELNEKYGLIAEGKEGVQTSMCPVVDLLCSTVKKSTILILALTNSFAVLRLL